MKTKIFLLFGMIAIAGTVYFTSCQTEKASSEHPPVIPYWALGHLVWEDSVNTQEAAQDLVQGYLDHQIPVDALIIDSPWEMSYNDFNWDTARYPDPRGMLDFMMDRGVHTLLWMTGCINTKSKDTPLQKDPAYNEVIRKGYAVNNGKPYRWWKGVGVQLDFTDPDACAWWDHQLDKAFVKGVYGWKTDQGEHDLPGDTVLTSIGRVSKRAFKKYYYNHMWDYTVAKNPEGIILARPYSWQGGYAADIAKGGVGWCGDFKGDWKGLKDQIHDIYTSVKAGYGAVACEIGGFTGARSTKEQLIRYAQFGASVAMMDNGGANGAFTQHLPWYHDEETTEIYRDLVTFHRALRPYIFSTLVEDHLSGKAWINTVSMEQESHKLGDDLFFKAITSDTMPMTFTLPKGDIWYDWWNGKQYEGGSTVIREYPLNESPVFIRAGAVIPLDLNGKDCPAFDRFNGKTVILLYAPRDRRVICHKPLGSGTPYQNIIITCKGDRLIVDAEEENDYVFILKKAGQPVVDPAREMCGLDVIKNAVVIEKKGNHLKFHFNK